MNLEDIRAIAENPDVHADTLEEAIRWLDSQDIYSNGRNWEASVRQLYRCLSDTLQLARPTWRCKWTDPWLWENYLDLANGGWSRTIRANEQLTASEVQKLVNDIQCQSQRG